MNNFEEIYTKVLEDSGFKDITYDRKTGFCGTLLPYSNIRPFQKEKIRYYNITAIITKLIYTQLDKIEPVVINCEKEEVLL